MVFKLFSSSLIFSRFNKICPECWYSFPLRSSLSEDLVDCFISPWRGLSFLRTEAAQLLYKPSTLIGLTEVINLYSTQILSLLDWGLTLFPSLSSVEAEYLYLAFVLWRVASITQHCLFMKSIHAISGSRSPFFLLVAFCCIKYSLIYWCTL